jgi:DNA-binding FadR family transcriptional regulator
MDRPAVTNIFTPVTSPSTFEETVARLGRAIRLGVLEPGTRLPPERELAEQLSISRSTLRQALRALTETGHLVAQRGRTGGTFVAADPPMYVGGYEIASWQGMLDRRTAVELGAIQLAAERATDEDLAPLAGHVDTMRASIDDWRVFRTADVHFHLCIAEASHSPWLVQAMTEVHGEFSELLDLAPHPSVVLEHSTEQHARIVEALEKRDEDECIRRMREHIRGSEALFEGLGPAEES